jgi:preprotein translocase subunit SecF
MWRILIVTIVGSLCTACSGGISSYEEGIEAQAEIMVEMVSVLEGVTDQESADKASAKIEALGGQLAEVTAQVKELPQPTMKEMQEIAQKQRAQQEELQKNAVSQMMKLDQYDSLHKAWTRALAEMR